jgi:hypothetical protein
MNAVKSGAKARLCRRAICQLVAQNAGVAPDLHHFDPGPRPVKLPYFGHQFGVFENVPAPADHTADILAVHVELDRFVLGGPAQRLAHGQQLGLVGSAVAHGLRNPVRDRLAAQRNHANAHLARVGATAAIGKNSQLHHPIIRTKAMA